VGGRTRHIKTRQYYLWGIKEKGIISVIWKKETENNYDMFTKNLGIKDFDKHATEYVGNDEYMEA
jgi:hypothetical protein